MKFDKSTLQRTKELAGFLSGPHLTEDTWKLRRTVGRLSEANMAAGMLLCIGLEGLLESGMLWQLRCRELL